MSSKEKFNFMDFMGAQQPKENDAVVIEKNTTESQPVDKDKDKPLIQENESPEITEKTTSSQQEKKPARRKIENRTAAETENEQTDIDENDDLPKKQRNVFKSITFPEEDFLKINYLASKYNISLSNAISQMIHQGLSIYEQTNGTIPIKEYKKAKKNKKNLFL